MEHSGYKTNDWIAIMTEIVRDLDQHGMEGLINTVDHWKTADQGAASLVVAAFDPALDSTLLSITLFFQSPAPHFPTVRSSHFQ